MVFSHIAVRPIMERFGRFWPLLILLFIAILYFARIDISMSEMASSYGDARKFTQKPSKGEAKALPYPLAISLVHYATINITPQQTRDEIMVTTNILSRRGPCNFLIFGLGFDSPLWQALNHRGRTVFLEEDPTWIAQMAQDHPYLESYPVNYTTILSEADDLLAYARKHREICSPEKDLLQSDCKLAIKTLPAQIYGIKWDVIMIDAPRGYFPEAPGRMSAIYSSAVMAMAKKRKESTDILLHDVDRPVEKTFSTEFFCAKNLIESVGKLWHFQIFGEGPSRSTDFCSKGA